MENWILVKNLEGEDIKVRQSRAYGDIFVDEQDREYLANVLDFTGARLAIPDFNEQNKESLNALKDMMKSMDAKAIADHKAVIAEFEYWRKLRGEIFMEMYRDHLAKNDGRKSEGDLLNKTKYLVNQLWQQDQDFISDKKVFHIPVK
jgi:hypothetical protein